MKKLLLFVCILSWSYNTNAQCDDTLPILETFDTNTIGVCWEVQSLDADKGIAYDWYWREYLPVYGGYRCLVSRSYNTADGALTPDNWVISYPIDLTSFSTSDNIKLSWKVRGEYASLSHEYYSVYVASGNTTSDFTNSAVVTSEYADEVGGTGTFVARSMDISSLAGNTVYIAFRHYNSTDQYSINIDDIAITSGGTSGGCISDTDNDGVCDSVDQCPGMNDALIGTPCNDGNPCTINDIYDNNCGCSGTYADSDSDGVCDASDACPGFDDNVDVNNNGIPDGCENLTSCDEQTANFSSNSLTLAGASSQSITLLLPSDSQNISFTISNIDEKTKGRDNGRYIDLVKVTYKDASGQTKSGGTFSGDQVSSAAINIPGPAQSITVTLEDAYDGAPGTSMSIDLSSVSFCSSVSQSDPSCVKDTANFKNSTLTQTGSGSNSTTVSLLTNGQDASFTISGMDEKLKGKPGSQYIEHIMVTYVDGSGSTKTYNEYSGSNGSSVDVIINDYVKSITVTLDDLLNMDTSSTMSVDLSAVSYCVNNSAKISESDQSANLISDLEATSVPELTFKIYPNPASNVLFIKDTQLEYKNQKTALLYNLQGTLVLSLNMNINNGQTQEMHIDGLATGLYLLRIIDQKGETLNTQRIVIK